MLWKIYYHILLRPKPVLDILNKYFEEALLTKKKPPLGNIKGQKCGNGQRRDAIEERENVCEMFNFTGGLSANGKWGLMGCRLDDVARRVTKHRNEGGMKFFALKM